MAASTVIPALKFCSFDRTLNTSKTYICYRNEVCCPQGCCSLFSYKYFQNWQFWVTALIIFGIFYLLGKYCKKLERNRARNEYNDSGSSDYRPHYARQGEDNVNNLLEHFLFQYRTRCQHHCSPTTTMIDYSKEMTHSDPPPVYNVALNMPKPAPLDLPGHSVTFVNEQEKDPARTSTTEEETRLAYLLSQQEEAVPSYEYATSSKTKQYLLNKDDNTNV